PTHPAAQILRFWRWGQYIVACGVSTKERCCGVVFSVSYPACSLSRAQYVSWRGKRGIGDTCHVDGPARDDVHVDGFTRHHLRFVRHIALHWDDSSLLSNGSSYLGL
ncbi:unnamed protein product, partial [Ectocarpus fasciculatus]